MLINPLDDAVRLASVPGSPGVYILGCLERNLSAYLQQVRALNLIFALSRDNTVRPDQRVCVIGAGFAGLTAAVAAARRGCQVTVLEQDAEPFLGLRACTSRWLHPHIHEWPRENSMNPSAGLPFLDWQTGTASTVAEQVLSQFRVLAATRGIRLVTGVRVDHFARRADSPWEIGWNNHAPVAFDTVIVATGPGQEKRFEGAHIPGYWTDRPPQTLQSASHEVLVSGNGQSGLCDVLAHTLTAYRADRAAQACLGPETRALQNNLMFIEHVVQGASDENALETLNDAYPTLEVPTGVDAWLHTQVRPDTHVTLNSPTEHWLNPHTDILSRFLASRLFSMGVLHIRVGRLAQVREVAHRFHATFQADANNETVSGATATFDEVLIRHGCVSSLALSFPSLFERYAQMRREKPDHPVIPAWSADFYR